MFLMLTIRAMRTQIEADGGTLQPFERVRTVKAPVPRSRSRREAVIRVTIADLGVTLAEMLLMGRPLP